MPDLDKAPAPAAASEEQEGFLSRWSRRKQQAEAGPGEPEPSPEAALPAQAEAESEPAPAPTDADMPPLESLDADTDYSGFMSPEVSDGLRRLALRKLFHLPEFNAPDGLNDYDEDYTDFKALGDIVTHEMRRALEREEAGGGEPDEALASADSGAQGDPDLQPAPEAPAASEEVSDDAQAKPDPPV